MFCTCCVISSGDIIHPNWWMEILDCHIPCSHCHESPSNTVIEGSQIGAFVIATEQIIGDQLDSLIKRIRNLRPNLPIILVGSQRNLMDSGDALIANAVDGVPVNPEDICASILSFIREHIEIAAVNRTARAIIARICHEMNNPATAILGTAELLIEEHREHLDDRTKRDLQTIMQQAQRIGNVTKRLANLEKFEIEDVHGIPILKLPE